CPVGTRGSRLAPGLGESAGAHLRPFSGAFPAHPGDVPRGSRPGVPGPGAVALPPGLSTPAAHPRSAHGDRPGAVLDAYEQPPTDVSVGRGCRPHGVAVLVTEGLGRGG